MIEIKYNEYGLKFLRCLIGGVGLYKKQSVEIYSDGCGVILLRKGEIIHDWDVVEIPKNSKIDLFGVKREGLFVIGKNGNLEYHGRITKSVFINSEHWLQISGGIVNGDSDNVKINFEKLKRLMNEKS